MLRGRTGQRHLRGGSRDDWATYDLSATAVHVNLTTGTASGEGNDLVSATTIENVIGSPFADVGSTGNGGVNILYGSGQERRHQRPAAATTWFAGVQRQ